jgi:hypothetical protein
LASSASDCALGSMIPRPLLDKGSVRESHLTLARVLEAFPPQMKLDREEGGKGPRCG